MTYLLFLLVNRANIWGFFQLKKYFGGFFQFFSKFCDIMWFHIDQPGVPHSVKSAAKEKP